MKFYKNEDIIRFGNIKEYDFYIFELLIHNKCDFKCSYCYMRNEYNNWNTFASILNIKEIFKILKKIQKYKELRICLSGGEALLHPQIHTIINLYKKYFSFELHINTNLGNSFEILKEIIQKYPDLKIILHSSIHPLQINKQEIIKKIEFIEKNKIECEYNYIIDPKISGDEHFENIKNYRKLITYNKLFLKSIYILSRFKFYKNLKFIYTNFEWLKNNIDKEYFIEFKNGKKILLNDIEIITLFDFPFNFKNYICNYKFFTIDANNFKIKEMCENFNLSDIRADYSFFIKYSKNTKIKCPHDQCLWPSALDMVKEKHVL